MLRKKIEQEKIKTEEKTEGEIETEELIERRGKEYAEVLKDDGVVEEEKTEEKKGIEPTEEIDEIGDGEVIPFEETPLEKKQREEKAKEIQEELERQADVERSEIKKEIESIEEIDEIGDSKGIDFEKLSALEKQREEKAKEIQEELERQADMKKDEIKKEEESLGLEEKKEEVKEEVKEEEKSKTEPLKMELSKVLEHSMDNLRKRELEIKNCENKIEGLDKSWLRFFKKKEKESLIKQKEIASENLLSIKKEIATITADYLSFGLSEDEIKAVIQEKIKEEDSSYQVEIGESKIEGGETKFIKLKKALENIEESIDQKIEIELGDKKSLIKKITINTKFKITLLTE